MYKGINIYLCAFINIELAPSIVRFHNQMKESEKRFYEYLDIVIEHKALRFKLQLLESNWTKADLFNYFGKLDDNNITDTPHS